MDLLIKKYYLRREMGFLLFLTLLETWSGCLAGEHVDYEC